MKITASLFDAGLKCLTKCFLRSLGEEGAGNAYAEWVRTKSVFHQREGIKRLMARAAHDECIGGLSGTENLKTAEWRFAMDFVAEHAVKAFATLRRVIDGLTSEKGIREYLVLLSISETCKYKEVDFLDFLRSGEKDIRAFAESKQRRRRGDNVQPSPCTASESWHFTTQGHS